MFNHKYVSLKEIVDRIMKGNLYKGLPYESAITYGVDAYRLLASDKAEVTLPAKTEIKDYRGMLPENFERVVQTARVDDCMNIVSAMRYATDTMHSVLHCFNSPDIGCNSENTYSLNNNYIHTSFKEGFVFMAYKGLAVDENCIPTIPDNINVILAVEFYIKYKYLDDLGSSDPKVERQYNKDYTEYCWYIGKAQNHMTSLSIDEYESFANSMSQWFGPTDNHHKNFLKNLGAKQLINNHRYG